MEFEPDKWLRVVADTKEKALEFFGAPSNWPVRFVGFMKDRKGRVFEVLAEGLIIK